MRHLHLLALALIVSAGPSGASSPRQFAEVLDLDQGLSVRQEKRGNQYCLVIQGGELCSAKPVKKDSMGWGSEVKVTGVSHSAVSLGASSPAGAVTADKDEEKACREKAAYVVTPNDSAIISGLCAGAVSAEATLSCYKDYSSAGMPADSAVAKGLCAGIHEGEAAGVLKRYKDALAVGMQTHMAVETSRKVTAYGVIDCFKENFRPGGMSDVNAYNHCKSNPWIL